MARTGSHYRSVAVIVTLAALAIARPPGANAATLPDESGSSVERGHRLAQAWCRECHAIDANTIRTGNIAPDFVLIASQPSTTALALKVFLRSNHARMPNLIIAPADADDLVQYILGLKRD
jgi:mono/diheme cytochrome c family protein